MGLEQNIYNFITSCSNYLWSGPLLLMLIGVGGYQTWKLKGIQFRYFWRAITLTLSLTANEKEMAEVKGDISAFQALMTALAGSIGTGSITGIATAVATGGLGALFWMWVVAFFGMATAYSETVLAIKYRCENKNGNMAGGPMYTLSNGLNMPKLAKVYAVVAFIATIGIGCLAQSNSMVDAVTDIFMIDRYKVGIFLAITTGFVIIGGVQSIGRVAGLLVPFMAVVYFVIGLGIIGWNYEHVLPAFRLIINSAFNGQAAVGGFLGSTVAIAIQNGAQYGIFANEAGMGSLAIAAASAKTVAPPEQGLRSVGGVFFATMIVCTLTGLIIAIAGVVGITDSSGNLVIGTPLAMAAFRNSLSGSEYIVMVALLLFAFTTMLAWAYYGEKCMEFLLGLKAAYIYRWVFTGAILLGAVLQLKLVWAIANLTTALVAVPNLISIIGLSKQVVKETDCYLAAEKVELKLNEGMAV